MLTLNIFFASLAAIFIFRSIRLFLHAKNNEGAKECAIALAIALMHGLILTRSLVLINIGEDTIRAAGLLLNYYLHLGTITIQMLISDFVIKFLYDKITTRNGS